jgi:hypothetical protein
MVDPGGWLDAAFELAVSMDDAADAAPQILGVVEIHDEIAHKLAGYIMVVGPRLRDEWERADAAPSP